MKKFFPGARIGIGIAAAILLFIHGSAYALKMAPDTAVDVFSPNKKFVVHSTPVDESYGGAGAGKSEVYEVTDGARKLLFTVPYFSRSLVVADDGQYLVMVGRTMIRPYTKSSKADDLALAFYH